MKSSKKFVRLVIIVTIMSFFMFGCGKTEVTTDTNTEKEDVVVETPETTTEVVQPQEEETVEVVEPEAEEPVEEEPAEETLANEIIMNSDPIADWVATLEEEDLKFIIYNDVEGYKQILNDGETYHMKKEDKIFLYHPVGGINNRRNLTRGIYICAEGVVYTDYGYSVDILWQDKEVVTYGEELIMSGNDQTPKSITCTFYKATE